MLTKKLHFYSPIKKSSCSQENKWLLITTSLMASYTPFHVNYFLSDNYALSPGSNFCRSHLIQALPHTILGGQMWYSTCCRKVVILLIWYIEYVKAIIHIDVCRFSASLEICNMLLDHLERPILDIRSCWSYLSPLDALTLSSILINKSFHLPIIFKQNLGILL
jgi:hypothetical protein